MLNVCDCVVPLQSMLVHRAMYNPWQPSSHDTSHFLIQWRCIDRLNHRNEYQFHIAVYSSHIEYWVLDQGVPDQYVPRGDDRFQPAIGRTFGIVDKAIGSAVRRDDLHVVRNAELFEDLDRMRHRRPVRLAAHDDTDLWGHFAHSNPSCPGFHPL